MKGKLFCMFVCAFLLISAIQGLGYNITNKDNMKLTEGYSSSGYNDDCWPMWRYDSFNSGFSPTIVPDTNNVLWNYETETIWNFVSSPVVSDGKVFFNGEGDNKVYCLDSDNGEEIWITPTNYNLQASSPAVIDGKLYDVSSNKRVFCLDADNGVEIWNFTTDYGIYTTSPTIHDGKIYIADNRKIYCIDCNNGTLLWKKGVGQQDSNTATAVAYGNVYVTVKGLGDEDGRICCLDAEDGELKWCYNASIYEEGSWLHVTSPLVYNNSVYTCVYIQYAEDAYIYCFDAETGNKTTFYTHPSNGYLLSTPAIAYGNIYVTTSKGSGCIGNIYCIDIETGDVEWKSPQLNINNEMWSHARFLVVADQKVIFHDVSLLYCIDAFTGDLIWYKIPSELGWYSQTEGEPVIVNGTIYICYGKRVCAFNDDVSINLPSDPSPEDGAVDLDINQILSWKGGDPDKGDNVRYLIFFGKNKGDLNRIYDEIGPYPWNQTNISWDPGQLEHDTTYYWKIVPIDEQGSSKTGPIWQFRTNYAPNIPKITGPNSGNPDKEYNYIFFTTEPTGDDISYYVDWGDGTFTDWTDFVPSGTSITLTHTWEKIGTYSIRAKAKDTAGAESDWGTFEVTMPKNMFFHRPILLWLLERLIERFPILERLLI